MKQTEHTQATQQTERTAITKRTEATKLATPRAIRQWLPWAVIAILLVILAGQTQVFETKPARPKLSEVLEYRRHVNDYLMQTDLESNLRRTEAKVKYTKTAPPIRHAIHPAAPKVAPIEPGVDLSTETWAEERHELVRQPSQLPSMPKDIDNAVNAEISFNQEQGEYNEKFRLEFEKQLIQNAARDGYDLKIVNDQVIINRRPNSI